MHHHLNAQAAARPDGAPPVSQQQYLRFALGSGVYAVPIDSVREILELSPTTALPLMPDFVRGVMNLRGAVVPVIDLAARFGLPPAVLARRTCIVVVEVHAPEDPGQAPQVLGLMVDAVHEVLETEGDVLEDPPALGTAIAPQFIEGIARSRETMVSVLNLPRALDSEELAQLIANAIQH
ncbi:MAG: purine-binding chemotaxis protein CheW [Burkholderiales bacterium]|nr:purine-binding chemotaxis protein CheW [Burkholderiales bacterium]